MRAAISPVPEIPAVVVQYLQSFMKEIMSNVGRKEDNVWKYFEKTKHKTGFKAKCLTCGKVTQGIVARLKTHYLKCQAEKESQTADPGKIIIKV